MDYERITDEKIERGLRRGVYLYAPDETQQILSIRRDPRNREIRPIRVSRYAADMQAGLWLPEVNDAIVFDERGVMMNGHHRLLAVIRAACPVAMETNCLARVAWGRLDGQVPRTMADVLNLDKNTVAVLNALVAGMDGYQLKLRPLTQRETRVVYEAYSEAIAVIRPACAGVASRRYRLTAPVFAAIARAYRPERVLTVARFCEVLCTGVSLAPAEATIVALREALLARKYWGFERAVAYAKTARALQAYLTGETLARLYAAPRDPFPPCPAVAQIYARAAADARWAQSPHARRWADPRPGCDYSGNLTIGDILGETK